MNVLCRKKLVVDTALLCVRRKSVTVLTTTIYNQDGSFIRCCPTQLTDEVHTVTMEETMFVWPIGSECETRELYSMSAKASTRMHCFSSTEAILSHISHKTSNSWSLDGVSILGGRQEDSGFGRVSQAVTVLSLKLWICFTSYVAFMPSGVVGEW